jgi:protein TonB
MKTEMTRPTWEDIVFESRNKEYGAYSIRKSYNENISKASLIALFFAACAFGIIQVASMVGVTIKIPHPDIPTIPLPPPKIITEHPIKRTEARTAQHVNRDILERVVTHEVEPAPVEPIEVDPVGSKTGTPTDVSTEGIGLGQDAEILPGVAEPPKIIDIAEVMPHYEGGLKAMSRFISKNIHYPAGARMTGQEGTVYVRFVVNSLGQVVDVEVIKGVCALLDNEAMRVIATMSKWKPGLQHNLPVNVRMVLPIKFKLEQE